MFFLRKYLPPHGLLSAPGLGTENANTCILPLYTVVIRGLCKSTVHLFCRPHGGGGSINNITVSFAEQHNTDDEDNVASTASLPTGYSSGVKHSPKRHKAQVTTQQSASAFELNTLPLHTSIS